ncbi:unnamed protein product [Lactuca saligna]|uniref:Uncharacterized protein n=1 Tax=Lactuca saligna TaxID=75948 RepID=A0AA35VWF1_LACSI|nr:unnamed protein product [Lactuca saligna]
MATAFETPYVGHQTASLGLLNIKANIISSWTLIQPNAMSLSNRLLSVFVTLLWIRPLPWQRMPLDSSIQGILHCKLSGRDLIDLDSIASFANIEMFYKMGYVGNLAILSKFKKPNLPPMQIFALIINILL